jgi:glycosyltransferase involved in cell wall biosynthesis
MNRQNTIIIMPVYNEEQVVREVIGDIKKYFEKIICVNDGSTDNSSNEIIGSKVILIEHPINLGAGAATQTGIDYAIQNPDYQYFITIDADGQHNIKDAVNMLDYLKKHKLDIVFGSRFIGNVENIGKIKRIFLKTAALFSYKTTKIKLTDPHIGLRVFNREFAENLKLTLPDFTHASEVIRRVKEGHYNYAEFPVTITYSDYSKSKGQSMMNAINITIDLFLDRISKK